MPHKFYHGRTGRVWNVTKRAVGVEVNKQVGNRIIRKRIHVRIEHVQQSRCHEEVMLRIKKNDQLKADAKAQGKIISTKRQPEGPKPGFMVEGTTLETVTPIPYDVVNDLKGANYLSTQVTIFLAFFISSGGYVAATVGSCSSRAHIVMKAISAAMVILVALALAFASGSRYDSFIRFGCSYYVPYSF
ncbi:hypothetical protein SASPL_126322 [Salvia splendens]|uniref:Large subunit ribosomal protein L21e n=1 Tax=Salvia splendens TaxID=180675 RepID=A0A8X8ZQV9_SALSN|nr:hypothetical protein SASPL_126322 [Salvia splendens]